jgi:ATP-dependent Clp protease ATP-binding subunit ClpX
VTLDALDEDALVRILTEPKSALVKQYKKLLGYDNVELEFTQDALVAISRKAMAQNTGARGLRTIMEKLMLDLMYEVPSRKDVKKVLVTKEAVEGRAAPTLMLAEKKPSRKREETA